MIQHITSIEEGVKRLFVLGERESVPFSYKKRGKDFFDTLTFDNETIPLLKWRYNPKIHTMHLNFTTSRVSTLGAPSTIRSFDFAPSCETMEQLLAREIDIAEFFVDSQIISAMGFGNDKAANFIFHMKNGVMVHMEVSVTMPSDAERESKHVLYTTNGMISDTATDKVVDSKQIHVFTDNQNPVCYTDFDVNLYGLTLEEQDIAYACYGLMTGIENKETWLAQADHIREVVAGAMNALHTGRKFSVK